MSQFRAVAKRSISLGGTGTLDRVNTFSSGKCQKICPNCGDRGIVVFDGKSGDELCCNCGLVLESRVMSEEQEWRSFANTDGSGGGEKSRVGGPSDVWLQQGVQGTTMVGGDKKHSTLLHAHETATATSGGDRQLLTAFNNLRMIAESFSLGDNIVERCKEMVKDLQTAGHLRNRTGSTYMMAVVYVACREERTTITIRELVVYDPSLTSKELGRAINRVKKMLPARGASANATAAAELMERFCSRLQLSEQVLNDAEHVCRKAQVLLNRSHRPSSVAAAAIYLITHLRRIKVEIADIATVARSSPVTVQNVYRELVPLARKLLPPNFEMPKEVELVPGH